ncbi:MAG: hypothetical protein KatS3mg010_1085 [Acidimicrobiia bacterium]|nr:MAG: hypothetical protein KatS3mg010_1085 [Acidimicrobiia bacterium]
MTDVDLEALDETGPIDFVVVEWPAGREPDGSALPLLLDLVDRRIIRVLDLAFVKKGDDGSVTGVDVSGVGFGDEVDVTVFAAARSGLLGDDDLDEAGRVLDPGASAAVLVYENAWAGPFARGASTYRRAARRDRADPGAGGARVARRDGCR